MCGSTKIVCDVNNYGQLDDIISVDNFVYLGVTIDKNLNFEKFIGATIGRAQGRLISLARIRKLIDARTCLLIYKQTI